MKKGDVSRAMSDRQLAVFLIALCMKARLTPESEAGTVEEWEMMLQEEAEGNAE